MAWRLNLAGNSARLPNVSIRTFGPNGLATWGAAGFAGCDVVEALGGAGADAPPGAADFAAAFTVRERRAQRDVRHADGHDTSMPARAGPVALGRPRRRHTRASPRRPQRPQRSGPCGVGPSIMSGLFCIARHARTAGRKRARPRARQRPTVGPARARCVRRSDRAYRRAGAGSGLHAPTGRGARGMRAPRARIAQHSSVHTCARVQPPVAEGNELVGPRQRRACDPHHAAVSSWAEFVSRLAGIATKVRGERARS